MVKMRRSRRRRRLLLLSCRLPLMGRMVAALSLVLVVVEDVEFGGCVRR